MGKRKYESDKDDSTKKNKVSESAADGEDVQCEQPQNLDNLPKKPPKVGGFDFKHFRKELAAKQGQTMGKWRILSTSFARKIHLQNISHSHKPPFSFWLETNCN